MVKQKKERRNQNRNDKKQKGSTLQSMSQSFGRKSERRTSDMSEQSKGKSWFKFLFWTAVAVAISLYLWSSYNSGLIVNWYYYKANKDGYAINATGFKDATKEAPAVLKIGNFEKIDGLKAVPVKKGDRLPINANGIIVMDEIISGKRVKLEGDTIKVTVPWEIKESKGFKYKDTFKHKGIKTNQWAGAWNVAMVLLLGLSLGLLAEGFTDIMGLKIGKIQHGH